MQCARKEVRYFYQDFASNFNLHETEGSCTAAVSVESRFLLLSTKKVMALKRSNTTNGLLSNEHYRRSYGVSKEHFVGGK
jgi:hypothetical protein